VVEDTTLGGFALTKDTAIIPNIYSLHTEKQLWKDPENFRPERFLDLHGRLSLKKDSSLPFGAGKRLCVAETFSRNTMFLYMTAILQNFDFNPREIPSLDESGNGSGSVRYPKNFWLQLDAR
jgi:cytochrome P450